jgi:peptide/nickel transport system substrate-binding protein
LRVTLAAPDIRGQVAQAVAQMLSRAGIRTEVTVMPAGMFFSRRARGEFSLDLPGWIGVNMLSTLRATLGTADAALGTGSSNKSGYSNPTLDALLARAQTIFDDAARAAVLAEASEVAMADVGGIPLYFMVLVEAMRKDLVYDPVLPDQSLAANIRPAKPGE